MAHQESNRSIPSRIAAAAVLLLALAGGVLPQGARAQDGHPVDLSFRCIDASVDLPSTPERFVIQAQDLTLTELADIRPAGPEFTVNSVPIRADARYLLTATAGGVPYFWEMGGAELAAGPVTLHVFATSEDLAGVRVTGMNVLATRQESLLNLEIVLQVLNEARPQVTVLGDPTFAVSVPAGTSNIQAHYLRGPEPIAVATDLVGTRLGLKAPLTSGSNQIRIQAAVPWREGLELPVGCSLPVDAWSLLTTPAYLEVRAFDLEMDRDQAVPGFGRYVGPPLETDRDLVVVLGAGTGQGEQGDVFTRPAGDAADTAAAAPTTAPARRQGLPLAVPLGLLVVVIVVVVVRRRRK